MGNNTVSFHLIEDFKIIVGSNKTEVQVPRLKFRDSEPVLQNISRVVTLNATSALKMIMSSKETGIDPIASVNIVNSIESFLPQLIHLNCFAIVQDLLSNLTYNKISTELFPDLQYTEVCEIVSYLIRENFNSLKNLSASFEVISTSEKTSNQ